LSHQHVVLHNVTENKVLKKNQHTHTHPSTHTHTHTHTHPNEMADRLAKKAAMEVIGEIIYDKIPRETIITEGKENGLTKWQEQWASCTKGAVSKLFFSNIKERMKTRSSEFTAMVTGHGLTRSYLLRFKFIPNSTCPCRIKGEQTVNHIILNCTQLENERRFLRNTKFEQVTTGPHRLNNSQENTPSSSRIFSGQ